MFRRTNGYRINEVREASIASPKYLFGDEDDYEDESDEGYNKKQDDE